MSGTASARTGGSWRVNCPSGISGPRLRAGRRKSTTLKEQNLRFTDVAARAEFPAHPVVGKGRIALILPRPA
ncbi:hypothetical protein GCM10010392_55870 [Streptomyces clavifer]|nr:hypothetical protein GCM10010392_55870 [Streptomyces clavifer]